MGFEVRFNLKGCPSTAWGIWLNVDGEWDCCGAPLEELPLDEIASIFAYLAARSRDGEGE